LFLRIFAAQFLHFMTIEVSFPDGNVRKYDAGTTALQIAQSISEGLARNVLAAKVNDAVQDATLPLHTSCSLQHYSPGTTSKGSQRCGTLRLTLWPKRLSFIILASSWLLALP
jgi:hypothetical protein